MLGLSILEVERLWENDPRWITHALAAAEAKMLAGPIRREHQAKRAKEREMEAKERERARDREAKRAAWRATHRPPIEASAADA